MRLALGIGGILVAFLAGASRIAFAQLSNAAYCGQSVHRSDFESRIDGPFVTAIGYSKVLHSCVVVREQGFPVAHNQIEMHTNIVNTSNQTVVWKNTRMIRQGNHKREPYPALDEEIAKLEIELKAKDLDSAPDSKTAK
jgi:hypothetical protein